MRFLLWFVVLGGELKTDYGPHGEVRRPQRFLVMPTPRSLQRQSHGYEVASQPHWGLTGRLKPVGPMIFIKSKMRFDSFGSTYGNTTITAFGLRTTPNMVSYETSWEAGGFCY
jgi:hypothetical protein